MVNNIKKMQSSHCYKITHVAVKEYNELNYITFTENTTRKPNTNNIEREDEQVVMAEQLNVKLPSDGIHYVKKYM